MQTVNFAGSSYNIPNTRGDTPWSGLSDFAIAAASKCINTAGGSFTLLADINFGATYGLVSTYYKSRTANVASAGQLRLANADTIKFRNTLNNADLSVAISSNRLTFEGSRLIIAGAAEIVNADVSTSAAIALSKLASTTAYYWYIANTSGVLTPLAVTASRAVATDSNGSPVASTTTATELGYVNGVTSAIQTQMDLKAPKASPTFSGTITTPLTASRALATGASSELAVSATTSTELGYVNGVTSAIQTQINTKAPSASPTFTGTIGTPLTASKAVQTDGSGNLTTGTETGTGNIVRATTPTLTTPILGTPTSGALTNCTSIPVAQATGALPVANGGTGATATTGSGNNVLSTSPTMVTPVLGAASATSITFTSTTGVVGSTTNDSAATGSVGEYVASTSTGVNSTGSGQYFDVVNITLTAGDWDVTAVGDCDTGSLATTLCIVGIGTASGNSSTGLTFGDTAAQINAAITASTGVTLSVPASRKSISGSTTYYLKARLDYTGTTPSCRGRLSARRVR